MWWRAAGATVHASLARARRLKLLPLLLLPLLLLPQDVWSGTASQLPQRGRALSQLSRASVGAAMQELVQSSAIVINLSAPGQKLPDYTLTGDYLLSNDCDAPESCSLYMKAQPLLLQGGHFVFSNMHFKGPGPQSEAAVQISGYTNATFINCSFTNLGDSATGGGAMLVAGSSANVTFIRTRFENNTCAQQDCGGAVTVSSGGTIYAYRSEFLGNRALEAGGAIFGTLGAAVVVADSAFSANEVLNIASSSRERGGALCIDGGGSYAAILRCRFEFNGRPDQGGAVAVWDKAEALIVGCEMRGNLAASGGALSVSTSEEALKINSVRSQVWVYDTLFAANELTSGLGGGHGTAALATRSLLFLTNCTFLAQSSSGFGTVAGLGTPGLADSMLNLLNVTFTDNTAHEGGCLHASDNTTVVALLVRFSGCVARLAGGALSVHRASLVAAAVDAEDCAAGAIERGGSGQGGFLDATDSSITVSTAEVVAGAGAGGPPGATRPLLRQLGALWVELRATVGGALAAAAGRPSRLYRCSAEAGGGIKAFGCDVAISGVAFDECLSSDLKGGAALYVLRSQVMVEDCTFLETTCLAGPSTIYAESGAFLLTGGTFNCASNQMQMRTDLETAAQETSSSIRLLTLPGAVIVDTTFSAPMNSSASSTASQLDIAVNEASAPNVYVGNASAVALSPGDPARWASCWTVDVPATRTGPFSTCGTQLSACSAYAVASRARTFELPQLAAVVGAGTAGDCVVDERAVRAALAASAGVRIQASNCTAARVDGTPHEGFFNVAIVIVVTIVVFIAIFGLVLLIFLATKSSYILENTAYKSNIPLLREEEKKNSKAAVAAGAVVAGAKDAGTQLVTRLTRCARRVRASATPGKAGQK